MMKFFFKYVFTFLFLLILFNLFLFLGCSFSSNHIEKNVIESANVLIEEGNLYNLSKRFGVKNDNFTDSLMINEAYSVDSSDSITSYLKVRKNYKKGITDNVIDDTNGELISIGSESYDPVGELSLFLDGDIRTSISYARYWHGYLPFLRVLLLVFNISEIRVLLFVIFIILLLAVCFYIVKRFNWLFSIIFSFSLIFNGYFSASYSLENSSVFLLMMIVCLMLLIRVDKIKNFGYLIFIVGCISCFVDYLTVPLITLAFPTILYLLFKKKTDKISNKSLIFLIIKYSLLWGIGFAFTWISKWIIYDIIYDENLFLSAVKQVLFRTQSYNTLVDQSIVGRIMSFILNNVQVLCIFVLIYILFFEIVFRKKYKMDNLVKDSIFNNLWILIFSIMPIIWYSVLANHTLLHYYFVYRHMSIFTIGILLFFVNIFKYKKR